MKVPKKNIFKKMMDIRAPKLLRAEEEAGNAEVRVSNKKDIFTALPPAEPKAGGGVPWKSIFLSIFILVVFGGSFWTFSAYQSKKDLLRKAEEAFSESGLSSKVNLPGGSFEIKNFADITGKLIPLLRGGVGTYKDLMGGVSAWIKFGQDTSILRGNILGFLGGGAGDVLTPIKGIAEDVAAMNVAAESVDASSEELKSALNISPQNYLSLKYELKFWEGALASLANWLSSDRKIIVFFQNPAEMRPTGGFWGSYLELNIKDGKISDAQVRDINEVDRTLEQKTIPPKPLQALVTNWRTADSNWFFNFPDSAAKAAEFMDSSKLYGDDGSRVDMIATVSPSVIGDILDATGPVNVSSTKVAIDKSNFLAEIQADVQKGQDVGSQNAKHILDELFAVLTPKLASLSAGELQKILGGVMDRTKGKEIMVWAADEDLESIFKDRGVDGSVFEIPQRFEGDYLSVVSANIGGGKSDYMMSEKLVLESQLTSEGLVQNHLEITRKNNAKSGDKWWYKIPNQSYVRVFLSSLGRLEGAKGGVQKTVTAPINYKASGYDTDPLVEAVESTMKVAENYPWLTIFSEAGKTVLAAWQRTAPGATSKLSYDYSHRLFLAPADGVVYQFVMDKQPGVNVEYNFSFTAPVGFAWKENDSPIFEYKANDIPGRLIIDLTLNKS